MDVLTAAETRPLFGIEFLQMILIVAVSILNIISAALVILTVTDRFLFRISKGPRKMWYRSSFLSSGTVLSVLWFCIALPFAPVYIWWFMANKDITPFHGTRLYVIISFIIQMPVFYHALTYAVATLISLSHPRLPVVPDMSRLRIFLALPLFAIILLLSYIKYCIF